MQSYNYNSIEARINVDKTMFDCTHTSFKKVFTVCNLIMYFSPGLMFWGIKKITFSDSFISWM